MSPVVATRAIHEPLAPGMTRVWDIDEVLHEGDTKFQHVLIGRTAQGISLFCDNDRQSTEFSQLVYHEALLVPALLLADRVERVLVVGSSEGVVCQLAVEFGATQVDHVDIDEEAVRLCARHLPYGYTESELDSAERGDGPVRVRYADGWEFVRQAAESGDRYDVVLVDLPDEREHDPAAQHNRLYGADFMAMCRDATTPGGVVVNQAGCPTLWRNETLIRSLARFGETFATVSCFSSDEHEWAFMFGRADHVDDPAALMVERLATSRYPPRTIDADALRSRTVLPYHVRHAAITKQAD
ncbi:MAG TPA: spermidine synthase [Pseudonocardiaceae bacterium]|jgi:spermidine synthase|nr:spermidine synthase [Pseudonocardiaceae bacterium]